MTDALRWHPERLLEQTAWVRRLAGRLVFDAAAADDVAQETLVIALDAAPRDATSTRPWLAAISRSVVSRIRRSSTRREARERAVAQREPLEATDEIVARAEMQRAVVDAVLALAEPYRTAVLQRYFDDLPADEIATRRGEPVETVRTRIKRGIGMLRERLARELSIEMGDGRRRTGLGALVLLAEPAHAASMALLGATVMSTKVKFALVSAVMLVGSWATWDRWLDRTGSAATIDGSRVSTHAREQAPPKERAAPQVTDLLATSGIEEAAAVSSSDTSLSSRNRSPLIERLRAELTQENLAMSDVEEDLGPEVRDAIRGLQTESLDLDTLLHYVESRREDSWVVPGSRHQGLFETTFRVDQRNDKWIEAYENSMGRASIAQRSLIVSNMGEMMHFIFPIERGAKELGFDAGTKVSLSVIALRQPDGLLRSDINLNASLDGSKPVEWLAIIEVTNGSGRLTFHRTGAGRSLVKREIEQLEAFVKRCSDEISEQEASSKPK